MNYRIEEIQQIVPCESHIALKGAVITHIGFDSRRIHRPETMLFFALDGKSRSGADFIANAYQKGVRNFVVNRAFQPNRFPNANFLLVNNVLSALQTLAGQHRSHFTGALIGITGSNGKTIVKEWLYNLLQHDFAIARSPRSYNSTIGVAISLLGIEKWHNLALIEAGISKVGDMDELETMMLPSMGIFTHLGTAHDENFDSRIAKASEKIKLFRNCDVLVYPYDVPEVKEEAGKLKTTNPLLKTITWGFGEGASFKLTKTTTTDFGTEISFNHRSTDHILEIPFKDKASIENAMTCLCALSALERWDQAHINLFKTLQPLENRLAFTEGKNGNYLVNDSYSNDLDSLEVALDFLLRQQPDKPHTVILSELQQADPDKNRLYQRVVTLLKEKKTQHLIGIGTEMKALAGVFKNLKAEFYNDVNELLAAGVLDEISNQAILIKGARSFRLERVNEKLRKQLHKTTLEIDLTALRNNFSYFRHQLSPSTKIMAMVKAFGYGSGSFEASRTLQFAGAEYLAVAYVDEGVQLRKSGIYLPIMVMNTGISDLPTLLEFGLEPVIFNESGLSAFNSQAQNISVHIEIDTGMHRLGFEPTYLNCFTALGKNIKIASVFSHLAASESQEHDGFTLNQLQTFKQSCDSIQNQLGYTFTRHIANTGGILRFKNSHLDMVRLGIGLYGVDPSGNPNSELQTVLTLKSSISQIKTIKPGESVGYGRRGKEEKERKIAILPLGYADGLWRMLGNGQGYALIHGKPAPYIGSICMDMAMVDVTTIDCLEGDEVEIFGKHLKVELIAKWCNTIPYEILTSVSPRVRREYTGEN